MGRRGDKRHDGRPGRHDRGERVGGQRAGPVAVTGLDCVATYDWYASFHVMMGAPIGVVLFVGLVHWMGKTYLRQTLKAHFTTAVRHTYEQMNNFFSSPLKEKAFLDAAIYQMIALDGKESAEDILLQLMQKVQLLQYLRVSIFF